MLINTKFLNFIIGVTCCSVVAGFLFLHSQNVVLQEELLLTKSQVNTMLKNAQLLESQLEGSKADIKVKDVNLLFSQGFFQNCLLLSCLVGITFLLINNSSATSIEQLTNQVGSINQDIGSSLILQQNLCKQISELSDIAKDLGNIS